MSSNSNQAPFYVGQKVVCIDNSEPYAEIKATFTISSLIKEGNVYVVKRIMRNACCGEWVIDVGVNSGDGWVMCGTCKERLWESGGDMFRASRFAPYNPPYQSDLTKELAEKALSVGDSVDQPVKQLVNN